MASHRSRVRAGLVAFIAVAAGIVAVGSPGGAQAANPLPGIWYGVMEDGGDHVTTIAFGQGPTSSTPFVIVDLIPVGCGEAPEILVGRARLTATEVVFGDAVRHCPDGSTIDVQGFPMEWRRSGQIDSVTPAFEPVVLQRVCPRSVDDTFAGLIQGEIPGSPGPDNLAGTGGGDLIDALGGNDTVNAGAGNDIVCGGDGADTIRAGGGVDVVWGGGAIDVLMGEGDADVILGGPGNDRAEAASGGGVILGEAGGDTLVGGSGDDVLDGGAGNDSATGAGGGDLLVGGGGRDELLGGRGRDRAEGGGGVDRCDAETEAACER